MKLQYLLILALIAPMCLWGQSKLEVGLQLGGSNYGGDLVKPTIFIGEETNFGFGIFGRYRVQDNLAIRGNLIFSGMSGDDQNFADEDFFRAERDISFESPLTEFSVLAEFEPFGKKRYEDGTFKKILSPYVFAGLGFAFIDPDTDYSRSNVNGVEEDMMVDASNAQITIPVGAGVKLDLSEKTNIGFELGVRPTFTDYLEGVSLAGNPNKNDWYLFGGLVLSSRFGSRDKDGDGISDKDDTCPEVAGITSLKGCPDADGDNITDSEDICPNDPGLVALSGCPDMDGDGIRDSEDSCPDQPGLRSAGGCPDVDGDGIVDTEDACPNEPGLVNFKGCPDTDGDMVADNLDDCPSEPGLKERNGCPNRDADGDGVNDDKDDCPAVPGLLAFNGCPDTDSDGVIDELDKCPTIAGTKASKGCPDIEKEDKEVLDLAVKAVQFETGSAILKKESYKVLNQIVTILEKYSAYSMAISGHTDNVGSESKNQELSEKRAKSCFDYIAARGVKDLRMTHAGYGESSPVATNSTSSGRRKNRRVEFSLYIK